MKAIIFSSESAAQAALASCGAITEGKVVQQGEGPFIDPLPDKPYTYIIKSPTDDKWALVADEQVEAVLNETATELGEDWFPAVNPMGFPLP